ncbi:MAG: helix-turn-helix domain-containing protein [Lachnospiraceae bacterium]|nr:helix-turn-helix domain-containing protein [Lachnospiraceae bacterium]
MISNQVIQNAIDEVNAISRLEFYVSDGFGMAVAQTKNSEPVDKPVLLDFLQSTAETSEIGNSMLFKVYDEKECVYVLAVQGTEEVFLVGKITACQLQNLVTAYKDRVDRNSFYQNLLLDNLLLVDIYNRAQKLHIDAVKQRAVFVIEMKSQKEQGALEMVKELFHDSKGDHVTSVDERSIIVIKTLEDGESYEALQETAEMLVDMLNSEAMTSVRVAYGTIVSEIKALSRSYKEAKMALDVAGIFYAQKTTIAYNTLGIGRLIYQLPVNLCRIFIQEIFGDEIPEEIDEEMLNTVNEFFENSLNVSETSRQLFIHRNTLMYRIEKLQKATGLDIRVFDDALTFKIALMVVNYMRFIEENE